MARSKFICAILVAVLCSAVGTVDGSSNLQAISVSQVGVDQLVSSRKLLSSSSSSKSSSKYSSKSSSKKDDKDDKKSSKSSKSSKDDEK
eukprot:7604776-Pyramimonas_sp.AAC.1